MSKATIANSTAGELQWIDVEEPSFDIVHKLQKKYRFNDLDVEDILSPAQRPKIDTHSEYCFLIFRFPSLRGVKKKIYAAELDVVIKKNIIITFHGSNLKKIRALISDTKLFKKRKSALMGKSIDFLLYQILLSLFNNIYQMSDDIGRQLDLLETRLFQERHQSRNIINEIARIRKSLIDYQKIIKPQTVLLQQIINTDGFIHISNVKYWRNLVEISEGQWEIFETYAEALKGLSETNASLYSHRFDNTLRLLTIISVLFLPATFIFDIFDTNNPGSPFINLEHGFLYVIGTLFVVQLIFIWFLRRRHVI